MMLDLNVDTALSVNGCNNTMTAMVDSLTSTTTTNSKNTNSSISTLLSFSILNNNNNVTEVEDVDNVIISNRRNELQLFPVAGGAPSPAKCWLNFSGGDQVSESGISKPLVKKKSRRGPRSRSSQYRGVTFYRRTGRWESHIWDCGKQVYLGGFDTAHAAARAYDRAAIKFRGVDADINFTITDYDEDMIQMDLTKEEFVHILRRHSNRFSRGSSKHRGVTLHKCGQWEATMGQSNRVRFMDVGIDSNLNLNLGFSSSSAGNDTKSNLRFPCESPEGKRAKERAIGMSNEAGPLTGYPNWSWKIPSHGMVNPVPFLSSAASSGFSSATSPYSMPVLPLTSRATQFPAFQS